MAMACDSAALLLAEIGKSLKCYTEAATAIGLLYTGKLIVTATYRITYSLNTFVVSRLLTTDFTRKYGKWAVVTGSTDGIGKAYARELARRGMNIILVSRNMERLTKTAEEIKAEFKVDVVVVQADFSRGREVYPEIQKALGNLEIGILVNNVGVSPTYPMYITEMSDDSIWQHINVNIGAVTQMTRLVLPRMMERRRGAVVNLGSSAAIQPTPLLAVYSATKIYIEYFTRALQYEYKPYGITAQCILPFYVETNMTRGSGFGKKITFTPTAETFARSAVATLGYTSSTSGYWLHGIQYWLFSSLPSCAWAFTSAAINGRSRKNYLNDLVTSGPPI